MALEHQLTAREQQAFLDWVGVETRRPANGLLRWLPAPDQLRANHVVVHPCVIAAVGAPTQSWQAKWKGAVQELCPKILKPIRGCAGHIDRTPRGPRDLEAQRQRIRELNQRTVTSSTTTHGMHPSLCAVLGSRSTIDRSHNAMGTLLRSLRNRLEFDEHFAQMEVIAPDDEEQQRLLENIFIKHPNQDLSDPSVVALRRQLGVRDGEMVFARDLIEDGRLCLLHAAVLDPYGDEWKTAWLTSTSALPAGTIIPKECRDGLERPQGDVSDHERNAAADSLVFTGHSVKAGLQHAINHHGHDEDSPLYFGVFAPEDNDSFYQYVNLNNGTVGMHHELFAVYKGYFATPRAWFVLHSHGNGRNCPTLRYHPNPNATL